MPILHTVNYANVSLELSRNNISYPVIAFISKLILELVSPDLPGRLMVVLVFMGWAFSTCCGQTLQIITNPTTGDADQNVAYLRVKFVPKLGPFAVSR